MIAPDLASYDRIVVNSSAGKDSQAMLDYVVQLCDAAGVPRSRIVVVHADLGDMEWDDTGALARRQAEHYGLRFEVVSRIGGVAKKDSQIYRKGERFGDMLDYARRRGMWPSGGARWCTSDFKRGPVRTLWTRLVGELWSKGRERVRVLNCIGLRAQESAKRAGKPAFVAEADGSNGKRQIDEWLPIHSWAVMDVWRQIHLSGVEYHRAYDRGMSRLSCRFCVLASRADLELSGELNPGMLERYVAVEAEIGHTFKADLSLASVLEAVQAKQASARKHEQLELFAA